MVVSGRVSEGGGGDEKQLKEEEQAPSKHKLYAVRAVCDALIEHINSAHNSHLFMYSGAF